MPSVLKDCRACKPTKPMPRYLSDGSGRDVIIAFSKDIHPPNFNHFSDNRPQIHSKDRRGNAKVPAIARFVPDGSGRDLFQQQNNDYVFPVQNQIRGEAIIPKRRNISNYNRPRATPKYKPSGSGRDMSYSDIDVHHTTTAQNSFKIFKPSNSNSQMMRPRTSPPPRFVSSGSGRDSFQNPSAHRPASSYNPAREGFVYGSQSISQNARYRYGKPSKDHTTQSETMKRLCSTPKLHAKPTGRAKSASAVRTSSTNNNATFEDYFDNR